MSGRQTHLAELADCERALGRPERAIDLYRGADQNALDKGGAIELLIVAAGARGDLGQHDAAVAMLQVRELTADEDADWAARLRYAYADALLAAGRRDEAREWFARAAAADDDNLTDAAERLLELDGVTLDDNDDEDDSTALADEDDEPAGRADGEDLDDEPTGRADDNEDEDDDDELTGRAEDDLDDEHEDDDLDDEDEDDEDLDGLPVDQDDEDDEDDRAEEDDEAVARAGFVGEINGNDYTGPVARVDTGGETSADVTATPPVGGELADDVDAGIDDPDTNPRVDSEDEKALVDEFVVARDADDDVADGDDLAVEGGAGSDGKPNS
jgi:tetratricopeptide (TPR) repeat protein